MGEWNLRLQFSRTIRCILHLLKRSFRSARIENGQSVLFGALAQLGARYIRIVEAVGSNPICSTYKYMDTVGIPAK